MKAKLILENGIEFEGKAFGHLHETVGEVIFNTSMSGYQEILTDPAYHGQLVVMTYPLIGNYGINLDDSESDSPKVRGLIVREKSNTPNNFRCELELDDYLKSHKIMGLEDIDTRALTKIIRKEGRMKGCIVLENTTPSEQELQHKFETAQADVYSVSTKEPYTFCEGNPTIAVLDFGLKNSLLKSLQKHGCGVKVYPYNTKEDDLQKDSPDLILLSSGPGSPKDWESCIPTIQSLADKKPLVGIGLGHELIALAFGGEIEKLHFGHHGSNHPVKNLLHNKVYITAQNHDYYVKKLPSGFEMTHQSLNDATVQGMRHTNKMIYCVQFYPENGPSENNSIFDEFIRYAQEVSHA